ncbi:MAG TPA: alpha-L-fucosidase [Verrucomicrobiae bacterium]|jgi:alpha-L-fucosidase
MLTPTRNYFKFGWLLIGLLFLVRAQGVHAENDSWTNQAVQEADWQARGCVNDERGQWFRAAKFGAFIHFGVYSELGGYWQGKLYDPAEQILGLGDHHLAIPLPQYDAVAAQFNPANFNAHEWVRMIKDAGQKYLIITTKHHDGFCMYPTKTTDHNIMSKTPFRRDVIRELADECEKQGIVFCVYYSIGDWCAADVMSRQYKTYPAYMRAQLKELLDNYHNIKMIWLDNYWYVDNQWTNDESHARELYAYIHSLNPNVLINDRCGRGASSTDGDYATPENQLAGSRQNRYFEVVMTDTADDNWGWVKGATNYRNPGDLIHNLIDSTSKGGNFVLNVGPTATGEFSTEHQAILKVMGKWLATNGEAIYGAVPAPECQPSSQNGAQYYATKQGKNIYLHVTSWPSDGNDLTLGIKRTDLVKIELLDHSLPTPPFSQQIIGNITQIKITRPAVIDPYATIIKLSFKNTVAGSN